MGKGEGWGGFDVNTMITAVQVLPTLYCWRPTASEIEIKVESQSTLHVRVGQIKHLLYRLNTDLISF